MKHLKKLVALVTVLSLFGMATPEIEAAEYSTDLGGNGYQESRRAPSIAPAVALGTIALVAIIAVALQNQSHGHGHSH